MSYFDDLLKKPLPSASTADTFEESGDDIDFSKEMGDIAKEFDEETSEESIDDIVAGVLGTDGGEDVGDDDEEPETDIDSELKELEDELSVSGSLYGNEDIHIPTSVDDPTPAKPLSPEADEEADRMMAICATPAILEDALTLGEMMEFVESGDSEIAIAEGLILESDLSEMLADITNDSDGTFTEAVKFASPNQKYRMTKKAKLKQLYEISLQIEARLHNDPYYKKLQKAYKIERTIKAGWRKRYGQLAMRRAKKYLKALMSSKAPTVRKAAERISGK